MLICGNCRECFSEITELLDHKRTYCKLRFACKCQQSPNGNCGGGSNAVATSPTTTTAAANTSTPGKGAIAASEASSLSTSKTGIAGGPDTDIDLCGNLIVFAEIPSSSSSNSLGALTEATAAGAAAAEGPKAASARLLCVACKSVFQSPWDLMVHVQVAHMINIYELGNSAASASQAAGAAGFPVKDMDSDKNSSADQDSNNNNTTPKVPTTTQSSPVSNGMCSPVSKEVNIPIPFVLG